MLHINTESTGAMQVYFSRHAKATFDENKQSYSNFIDLSGLKPAQTMEILKTIRIYNQEHTPYIIDLDVFIGNFVLMAAVNGPEGLSLLPLDFSKNAEYMSLDVMADYCNTLVRFDNFCNDLRFSAEGFRKHNMNEQLIPA